MTTYNLSQETLNKALNNMISEGYMSKGDTTDDLISYARSAFEDNSYMVQAKITEWSF